MCHLQESSGPRRGRGACRPARRARGTQGALSTSPRGASGRGRPRGDPAQPPARPRGGLPGPDGAGRPSTGLATPGRGGRGARSEGSGLAALPTDRLSRSPRTLSLQRAELRERTDPTRPGRAQNARTRAPPPAGAAACAGGGGARQGRRGAPGGRGPTDAAAAHRGDRPGAQEVPLGGVQEAAALGPAGLHPGPQGGRGLRLPRGAESGNCPSRSKDERQVSKTSYRPSVFQPKVQQTLPQTLPQHPRLHHPRILQEVCPASNSAGSQPDVHGGISEQSCAAAQDP